ncbi:MAG: hypothetical protein WD834_03340 [Actinomycetota bacterium]
MRRVVAALILAAAIVPIWPATSAWACSCIQASRREHVEDASAIFVGVARVGEPVENAATALVTRFSVEAVYKGDLTAGSDVSIHHETQESACGLSFREGERFAVFVHEFGGQMLTSLCSLTRSGKISASRLGLPRPTEVVPAPPEAGAAFSSRMPWIVGLSIGTLAIAVGVALKLRAAHRTDASRPSV